MAHKTKQISIHGLQKRLLPIALSVPVAILVIVVGLLPGLLGYRPASIHGTSMEPTLLDSDGILAVYVEPTHVKVGDIAILEHPQKGLFAHRVVSTEPLAQGAFILQTKGDANLLTEWSVVASDEEIGIVILRIPSAGPLLEFTQTVPGLILLLLSIVVLLVFLTILIRGRMYSLDE